MGWLSRRKGVISVFLLIIFVVSFVFVGALVDAGRYRIAQTYAEAALDSATSSVLSHYNKLIYELYGIFAMDVDASDKEAMEAELKETYLRYVDETLGVIDLDTSEYGTILTEVVMGLFNEDERSDPSRVLRNLHLNGLYDFEGTENIQVGSVVTMADYSYVENQIVEHMKYRAPISLVESADGFIGTIKQISTLKDTIGAVKQKTALTKEYSSLPTNVAAIPESAATYAVAVETFLTTYTKANMLNAAGAFDKIFTDAAKTYANDLAAAEQKYRDNIKNAAINALEVNYKTEIKKEAELASKILGIEEDISSREADKELYEEWRDDAIEEGNTAYAEKCEDWIQDCDDDIDAYYEKLTPLYAEYAPLETIVNGINTYKSQIESAHVNKQTTNLVSKASSINNDSRYGSVDLAGIKKTWDDAIEKAKQNYKDSVKKAKGKAADYFSTMSTQAKALVTRGENLQKTLEANLDQYEEYITKLEKLGKEQKTVEDICTADVQTSKAAAGAIVDILPYVERMQGCLACFCDGIQGADGITDVKLAEWIAEREDSIIEDVEKNFAANPPKTGTSLSLKSDLEKLQAFKNLCIVRDAAYTETTDFMKKYTVESEQDDNSTEKKANKIKNQTLSSKDMEAELAKDEVTKGSKSIDTTFITENPGVLDINFVSTQSDKSNITVAGEVNGKGTFDIFDKLVGALGELISGLEKLLKNGRDNVYVNTYIMDTFPNYFTHYVKAEDNKDNKLLKAPYKNYNASLAEVEFILTGAGVGEDENYSSLVEDPEGFAKLIQDIKAFFGVKPEDPVGIGELSAKEFRTRLYGTRLLFNILSMLLDSTMYTQANAISAWAGPFAPAVAVVVMIAWVLAETVIDVKVLTASDLWGLDLDEDGDGKVPLLKVKSSQWHISVKGALEKITNAAVTAVVNEISMGVDQVAESVRGQADALMYDIYTETKKGANKTLDSILESEAVAGTKKNLTDWGDTFTKNVSAVADETNINTVVDTAEKVNSAIDNTISNAMTYAEKAETEARTNMDKFIDDTYKKTSTTVLEQYDKVSDEITKQTKSALKAGGDQMKNLLSENKDKVLPAGVVEGEPEGVFAIQMGYVDYLQFFLFIMNGEVKMKRVMALMQANLSNAENLSYKAGGQENIKQVFLEYYPASVWADMELSIKYMFMTDQLMPKEWKKDGRMRLKVISAQGY